MLCIYIYIRIYIIYTDTRNIYTYHTGSLGAQQAWQLQNEWPLPMLLLLFASYHHSRNWGSLLLKQPDTQTLSKSQNDIYLTEFSSSFGVDIYFFRGLSDFLFLKTIPQTWYEIVTVPWVIAGLAHLKKHPQICCRDPSESRLVTWTPWKGGRASSWLTRSRYAEMIISKISKKWWLFLFFSWYDWYVYTLILIISHW